MHRIACHFAVGVFIASGLIFVRVADSDWLGFELAGDSFFCVILGTQLGQTSLAALWCALGPGSLARRLPLAAVWLAANVLAYGFSRLVSYLGIGDFDPVASVGLMVLTQWSFIAGPLWVFADWRGSRIGHTSGCESGGPPNNRQIGILGTMVITAAIAVILGFSNVRNNGEVSVDWMTTRELGFFALVGVILALPLGVQLLFVQKRSQAILVLLIIVPLATLLDLFVFGASSPVGINRYICWCLFLLNSVHAVWIIATFLLLRLGGYELVRHRVARLPAA